jgi:hypothetical protein
MQSVFGQFREIEFFNTHRPLRSSAQRKAMMSVVEISRQLSAHDCALGVLDTGFSDYGVSAYSPGGAADSDHGGRL